MVKIKIISILISLVIFIFLLNVAYAARQALEFSDVDVKVGSKTDKNLRNGETISEEAEPGDTVEFRIEIKSNFTSAENLDIEDVQVTVTIEDIDDGEELEEESNEFDLSPGRDKRVTLKFDVPLEVDEDDFDVLIEAEGDDENGTDQKITMRLRLEVDKESHLLKITRSTLSPEEVSCNRKNVKAGLTVINVGSEDEEDVKVQILSPDLSLEIKEDIGELEAEPNEDSSRFSKVFTFNVPNDVEAGSYPITLRALYDDDRKKTDDTVTLTVNDCATFKKEEKKETVEEEEVEVVSPPSVVQKPPVVVVPPDTTVTEESFFKSNAFVVGVIIAEIIVVILGIILIVALFARRD